MSDKSMGRRTTVEVAMEGTDITASMLQYLKSLTYTDNEGDEADDLQIVLQDREGLWMEKWLNDIIEAAAERPEPATVGTAYTVTPRIGLNVRKGRGTNQTKLGALPCGTVVQVYGIENGWAEIEYSGQRAYVSAAYLKENAGGGTAAAGSGQAGVGLSIEAVIVRQNWNTDGKDMALDCGSFELDALDCGGPPAEVTIKATSLPYQAQIRQTQKTRGWENYRLSGIAAEMAAKNGMVCSFLSANDPFYERVEQYQMSDIALLQRLCRDAGISLKATNKMLVLFDQPDYEARTPVLTIRKDNGRLLPAPPESYGAYGKSGDCETYLSYRLSVGTADTQYQSCRVSYNDPSTGKCIEGIARVPDYQESEENQQLEVTARTASAAEAEKLAGKQLRLHNKYCRTAEFVLPGSPALAAGVTVELKGWGGWDGAYIVGQARHTVSDSGYTTAVSLRKVLEGY